MIDHYAWITTINFDWNIFCWVTFWIRNPICSCFRTLYEVSLKSINPSMFKLKQGFSIQNSRLCENVSWYLEFKHIHLSIEYLWFQVYNKLRTPCMNKLLFKLKVWLKAMFLKVMWRHLRATASGLTFASVIYDFSDVTFLLLWRHIMDTVG